jgi:hypothetical protein
LPVGVLYVVFGGEVAFVVLTYFFSLLPSLFAFAFSDVAENGLLTGGVEGLEAAGALYFGLLAGAVGVEGLEAAGALYFGLLVDGVEGFEAAGALYFGLLEELDFEEDGALYFGLLEELDLEELDLLLLLFWASTF